MIATWVSALVGLAIITMVFLALRASGTTDRQEDFDRWADQALSMVRDD